MKSKIIKCKQICSAVTGLPLDNKPSGFKLCSEAEFDELNDGYCKHYKTLLWGTVAECKKEETND